MKHVREQYYPAMILLVAKPAIVVATRGGDNNGDELATISYGSCYKALPRYF